MELSASTSVSKNRTNHPARLLNQQQLVLLINVINGSVFDTPDGLGFERIKTMVEIVAGISPKFFSYFAESLQSPGSSLPA